MKLFSSLPALVTAVALAAAPVHGAELVVGAPAELADCLDALSSAFLVREKGTRLRFVTAPSEDLYTKIEAGVSIDVYMSSQMDLQGQLLADGKMVHDSWTMYATGRLVLWAADKRFDVTKGVRLLADPAVKKVGTVNAGSAYLLPTLVVFDKAGLLEKADTLGTGGKSMQDAIEAVQRGKAQVAIVSYDTVLAASMKGVGKYYLIPESVYQNELPGHAAVVTSHGAGKPQASRFIQFLKTPQAQAILVPRGFMKPAPGSVDVR